MWVCEMFNGRRGLYNKTGGRLKVSTLKIKVERIDLFLEFQQDTDYYFLSVN